MLESYHKLQQKPKTVTEFKNALRGPNGKSDTIHTNIQISGPKLVYT